MTEYLAQLSMGRPGIKELRNGEMSVLENVPYRAQVIAMMALHNEFNSGGGSDFGVLFNAYHGDVENPEELKKALDAFYRINEMVSRRLGER